MARLLALPVLACLLCAPAPATTFAPATTRNLVDLSQRVCCVRCESVQPRLHPSGFVFTHVRLRVLEDLKGRGDGVTVDLRVIGGKTDRAETRVPGMPTFKKGGECVLMLGRLNRDGFPVIVAARRGVIGLGRDAKGQRVLVDRISGFDGLKGRSRVSLDAFRTAVTRAVADQKKRKAAAKDSEGKATGEGEKKR